MLKRKMLLNLRLESVTMLVADELVEGAVSWHMRCIKLLDLLQAMLFGNVRTTCPWLRRLKSQSLFLYRGGRGYTDCSADS